MSWVFVAGTVLTVAGTGATIAANQEANSAMHNARDAEAKRQEQLTEQRQQIFDQSLKDSSADNADQTINQKTASREAAYAQAAAPAGVAESAQGSPVAVQSTPTSLPDAGARARAGAKLAQSAWTRMVSDAQARLGGVGDWVQGTNIKNRRAAEDLSLNQDKARGSLNVNQYEVEQASHAGDDLRDIGTIAGALGSIGMVYGAAGLAAPAAATTGTQVGSAAGEAAEAGAADGFGATTASPGFWSTLAGTGVARRGFQ